MKKKFCGLLFFMFQSLCCNCIWLVLCFFLARGSFINYIYGMKFNVLFGQLTVISVIPANEQILAIALFVRALVITKSNFVKELYV